MQRLTQHILFSILAFQTAYSQSDQDNSNYLYGYKTLFMSLGATSEGRFLTLGYMVNRYVFEFEAAVEPRKIWLGLDSLVLQRQHSLGDFLGAGNADSNVAQYSAAMRAFYREKFKFIGALFELNTGLNFRSWISQDDYSLVDTLRLQQDVNGQVETVAQIYRYDRKMDFSAGPSLKMRISSGRDRGEPVLSLICTMDVNYFLANKIPTINFNVGIMISPFSYR